MQSVTERISSLIHEKELQFSKKPIIIGGMAMEYYGMRKAGADVDLVVCDEDYRNLARRFPEKRKDIWGDLGVILEPFEIWRCIMLLDYDFYSKDAEEEDPFLVVSPERLMLTRVFAMGVEKYMADLNLIRNYYCAKYTNEAFRDYQARHISSYQGSGGVILGGRYTDGNNDNSEDF